MEVYSEDIHREFPITQVQEPLISQPPGLHILDVVSSPNCVPDTSQNSAGIPTLQPVSPTHSRPNSMSRHGRSVSLGSTNRHGRRLSRSSLNLLSRSSSIDETRDGRNENPVDTKENTDPKYKRVELEVDIDDVNPAPFAFKPYMLASIVDQKNVDALVA